jgi:uncharacterized membrane protein
MQTSYNVAMNIATKILTVGLAITAIDYVWLGTVMKSFYIKELGVLARVGPNGGFAPNVAAAVVVYLALGAAFVIFVAPHATTIGKAAGMGALLGLLTYAVYDFTNLSILNGYSLKMALVDVAWGTILGAIAGALAFKLG